MMEDRKKEKLASLLQRLAAEYISRESSTTSLITVTHVSLSSDKKYATIFFTAYPETQEHAALDFVKRKMGEFREFLGEHARIGRLPFIDWRIDLGEKHRQKIDAVSQGNSTAIPSDDAPKMRARKK